MRSRIRDCRLETKVQCVGVVELKLLASRFLMAFVVLSSRDLGSRLRNGVDVGVVVAVVVVVGV